MSVVGRTHHIEVKGQVPPHVFKYLKKELGENVIFTEADDDLVDVFETDWYKEISASMTPGDSVRVYRENAGWSQAELGSRLGNFSRQYISDIERGKREISKGLARKLRTLFGVPIDRFI